MTSTQCDPGATLFGEIHIRKVGASLRSGAESMGQTVGVDRKVRVGSRNCNFTSEHTPMLPAELNCFAYMLIKLSSLSLSINIYILICSDVKLQFREPTRTFRSTPTVCPILSAPLLKLAPTFRLTPTLL
jgi:hypothetical protein